MNAQEKLQLGLKSIGIGIDQKRASLLLIFLEELLLWNRKFNLTAIRSLDEGIEKHLIDSLTVAPLLKGTETILDIGSGGGFPIIPLKIYYPTLQATSIDSVEKKIFFQKHAIRKMNLQGIRALHDRVENLAKEVNFQKTFDIVVSRAFSSLQTFMPLARPFLKKGGQVIAMKGPEGNDELKKGMDQEEFLSWRLCRMENLCLPQTKAKRTLLVFENNV